MEIYIYIDYIEHNTDWTKEKCRTKKQRQSNAQYGCLGIECSRSYIVDVVELGKEKPATARA